MARLLLLLLCLGCLAAQGDGTPPVPLPPVLTPPRLKEHAEKIPSEAGQVELEPGWTALSFPVERLEGVAGLSFALCQQTPEGYVWLQPGPWTALDTGQGYWVYADRKQTLRFWGKGQAAPGSTRLFAGWNLLGCPRNQKLSLSDLSLAAEDGQERTVAQASRSEEPWLATTGYRSSAAFTLDPVDLGQAQLTPGQTLWVYAYRPLELRRGAAGALPPLQPQADTVLKPGDPVVLRGPAAAQVDSLTLRGLPLSQGDIVEQKPDQLTVRLPEWASSGDLVAYRGARPLAPVPLQVSAPDPLSQGLLMGQAETADGDPLAGASVQVGDRNLQTGPDGRFYAAHLPSGSYTVTVTAPGYRTGTGPVTVAPGKLASVLVTLSSTTPRAEAPRGRMFITAYPFDLQGRRYWVASIRAWEVGDYSRRAYDSWWIDASSRQLDFSGARLGSRVRIEITWVDQRGHQKFTAWDRRFWKDWQNEYFYSPWN